jgi:hypothetical protein
MKLALIYTAREAWQRLGALKLPPQSAYQILKYLKLFTAEVEVVEQQRIKLIRDISGTKEGENASIKQGTPEFSKFAAEFEAVLGADSELKLIAMSLPVLLDQIGKDADNVLSTHDLAQLELFFDS